MPREVLEKVGALPSKAKPKRKVKKKLLRKRKSSSSLSLLSLPLSSDSSGSNDKEDKSLQNQTYLPKVQISSARINELSVPSIRATQFLSSLSLPANEYKKKLPLLSAIKPENEKAEKERFMRAGFNYNPYFVYRSPADEESMERFNTPSDQYLHIVS
jgi:hypothetical protein